MVFRSAQTARLALLLTFGAILWAPAHGYSDAMPATTQNISANANAESVPDTISAGETNPAYSTKNNTNANFSSLLQKQLHTDSLTTTNTGDQAVMHNKVQRLSAQISVDGVRITSLHDNAIASVSAIDAAFSLQVDQLGRNAALNKLITTTLQRTGDKILLQHEGLLEEFSNIPDGIRQDFIVRERPAGEGPLLLTLHSSGAELTLTDNGLRARLKGDERVLTYDHLKVFDAKGQSLAATMKLTEQAGIEIRVDDSSATYPLTIDPTVSDANWTVMLGYNAAGPQNDGFPSSINSVVIDADDNIYVGGGFSSIGNVVASFVAKWNGKTWSALGKGLTDSSVYGGLVAVLAIDTHGTIYAGGQFVMSGGVSLSHIAKWDGQNWSALGTGMNANVLALASSSTGELYAGGDFTIAGGITANHIAKWDGQNWSAVGTGFNDAVAALAVSRTGKLYAGGDFTTAGSITVNHIAKWDGQNWSGLGSGLRTGVKSKNASVMALALDSGGNLYVGGYFSKAGMTEVSNIAKWDGHAWSALGSGVNDYVRALLVDSTNTVYVAGYFLTAGDAPAKGLAKWNGSEWSTLGSGVDGELFANVAALAFNSAGKLFAAGYFATMNGVTTHSIARWNGVNWSPVSDVKGVNGVVYAVAADKANNVYASGLFAALDGSPESGIIKWNGSKWTRVGNGLNGFVLALAVDHDDNLYAGGEFTIAGTVAANNIAKWDGKTWSTLGKGLHGIKSFVFSLALDNAGNLYAGGTFKYAGGVVVNNIAQWNGSRWSAMGSGTSFGNSDKVSALTVDKAGNVYAGGNFDQMGGVNVSGIARWDGQQWSALGAHPFYMVDALVSDSTGNLYVGGEFNPIGGEPGRHIVKWDGHTWITLGSGTTDRAGYGFVYALAVDSKDNLYVGGDFTVAGGIAAKGIAKWDGSHWSALTSDGSGKVKALAITPDGDLLLGGNLIVGEAGLAAVARMDLGGQ